MSAKPASAAEIAAYLVARGIVSGTLSASREKANPVSKVKIRRLDAGLPLWQAEEFRGAKAFHENLDPVALERFLARSLGTVWTRAEFTLGSGEASGNAGIIVSGTASVLSNRRGTLSLIEKTARIKEHNEPGTQTTPGTVSPNSTVPHAETAVPARAVTPANAGFSARAATPANAGFSARAVTPANAGFSACATCSVPSHNREKRRILPEGTPVPFLVDLGVMSADGAVLKSKYDKYRQINRYLEFVEDTLPELEKRSRGGGETRQPITVVDFGCGKSYLTFAVYHYLVNVKAIPARIVGLDLKEDVISECSLLARKYGYAGLSFEVGDIAGFRGLERADMVMTLHACDTATDAALDQAVRWGAAVILSVPCCQHELNAQLGKKPRAGSTHDASARYPGRDLLEPAFRHGIVRERMAALLTDSLRAELLEAAGYRVQLLEFIDMTHTPKNLLVRATLRGGGSRANAPESANGNEGGDTPARKQWKPSDLALSDRYLALKEALGVDPALERYLANTEEH